MTNRAKQNKKKVIHFDFDTKRLQQFYPNIKNWRKAYEDMKNFLKSNGFTHRQWSGYVSDKALSELNVYDIIADMYLDMPWLVQCANRIDISDVPKTLSAIEIYSTQIAVQSKPNAKK